MDSSASIVNNIYDFIKKSKVRYARSLIQGYIKVTDDEDGIASRLNDKQMIVYDLDGFEAATGIDRY